MVIMKASLALLVLVVALVQARQQPKQPQVLTQAKDQYFQSKSKRGNYYIRQDGKSADCTFKGYAPNGPITSVGDIKAPKATLDAKKTLLGVLQGPTKKLGKVAAVAMHAMKFSASMMKMFPALGPALGVFSALSGMLGSGEPSPQDILDKVNDAIADLTAEVNKKMAEMTNYVDSSIAKAEKEIIQAEYTSSFRLWASCLKEPTEAKGNTCQRDSLRHIVSVRPKFLKNANLLKSQHVSMKQVRTWEAYMLPFRDYANLVVMQLAAMTQYYCLERPNAEHAAHYCQQYGDELIAEGNTLINYANNAIAQIKKGHWGKDKMGPCVASTKCSDIKEGGFWLVGPTHTANGCKTTCTILDASTKKYCEVRFTIRVDGKTPRGYARKPYGHIGGDKNFGAAQSFYGSEMLKAIAKDYQVKNHNVMTKYWAQEVLDFVPEWRKAIELAKEMKAKNPKKDDAPQVLDEGFSPEYETRLMNAGYVLERKSDGTSEVVPIENDVVEDEEENAPEYKISCDEGGECRFEEDETEEEPEEDAPESNENEFYSYSYEIDNAVE